MYWNRSAAEISAAWQSEIERKLETGSTALLVGGKPDNLMTSIATLLGLQNCTLQRNDVATPNLVAGGNSALWLGALLPAQVANTELVAPPPAVIFGGADEATHMAIVGMCQGTSARASSTARISRQGEMPGPSVQFAPLLQPGAETPWEMLPFVEVGERPMPSLAGTPAPIDPTTDWIAWGVMLLAFCLVVSAILI